MEVRWPPLLPGPNRGDSLAKAGQRPSRKVGETHTWVLDACDKDTPRAAAEVCGAGGPQGGAAGRERPGRLLPAHKPGRAAPGVRRRRRRSRAT